MSPPHRSGRVGMLAAGLAVVAALTFACSEDTPEVPVGPDGVPDPVLLLGRGVYSDRCANCHGGGGGGDRGPKLSDGATLDDYPEVSDQVEFVKAGKGLMPGFEDSLNAAELEAVVRFVRDVL